MERKERDVATPSMAPIISKAERIGVIGSPSSTGHLSLEILGSAVNKKLIGEFALLRFLQENEQHYALGQITEISLRNPWHEDPTMRSIIRQRGRVDAVSERQDTHQGEMTVSAVFSDGAAGYRPSMLGTVPATGTPIHLVDDAILNELLAAYREQLFYLGHIYGSTPKLPLWFKHFDAGPDGAGEAYHLGIFGKTGSGKSVLAKMILTAYARYPKMALLVIDPQGEFAKDMRGEKTGAMDLPVKEILDKLKKPKAVISVRELVLDSWELFAQILYESPFFEKLSIPKGENRQIAAEELADRLKRSSEVRLSTLHERSAFDAAWALLNEERVQKVFYRSDASRQRFQSMIGEADADLFYRLYWRQVAELFRENRPKARKIDRILRQIFNIDGGIRPLLILDLSQEQARAGQSSRQNTDSEQSDEDETTAPIFWNETIQALVIKRLLDGIRLEAERAYERNQSLNTLVLIDEAHRLAPREAPESETLRAVRSIFIDAVRTTRKYGLGWMFISQTLSSLHRDIIDQMRVFFFGFGLSMGTEHRALSELVGGHSKSMGLYQLFRDPQSAFDNASREYSFMTIGPVSPLSFAGTPLFFNAFNRPQEFLAANGWKGGIARVESASLIDPPQPDREANGLTLPEPL